MKRGRRRDRTKQYPTHIVASELPNRCYWDPVKKHWYTVFEIEGKQKRAKIAGAEAKMSDLHKAMELRAGDDVDNLIWLRKKFNESVQYKQLSPKTRADYDYCAGVIEKHPTKLHNLTVGQAPLRTWNEDASQKLIDQIAVANGPSAAAHCARYLRRLFNWSKKRGYVAVVPLGKLELPKERKRRRLPQDAVLNKLIPFAKERGNRTPYTRGACSSFIWKVLVIAKRCRLRGIEIFALNDAHALEEGLYGERTKGSRDSITRWTPDLREAVRAAQAERNELWQRLSMPVPMRAEDRPLLITQTGIRIKQSTWQLAWRGFLKLAIAEKIITAEQRFGLHDMKRHSITNTKGGRSAKLDAGGHKDERMLDIYDFEVPVVDAAGT